MAFVLGNQDFQQIRTDRAQRALEADRINARNFAEDEALRLANESSRAGAWPSYEAQSSWSYCCSSGCKS